MTRGRPRVTDGIPDRIQITIPVEMREPIRVYMANAGHPTVQSAVLELWQVAMASTPDDGLRRAAHTRAYREIKTWVLKRFMSFLSELHKDLGTIGRGEGLLP